MNDDTERLASDSDKYLDELRKLLEEVAEAWKEVSEKILDAKEKMDDYAQATRDAKAAEQQLNNPPSNPGGPTSNNNGDGGDKDKKTDSPKKDEEKKDNDTGRNYFLRLLYDDKGYASNHVINDLTLKEAQALLDEYTKKGYKAQIQHYDTGGYTGEQANKDGRLAVLHQKELVLNADDTKNFLAGINTIRDLTALNGSISNSIVNAIAGMVVSLAGIQPSSVQGQAAASSTSNDVYNITAEFPNAYSAEEIKQAILGLPNYASQYINRNVM